MTTATETVSNTTTSTAFKKVVHPADEDVSGGGIRTRFVPVFAKIEYSADGRLSISGVVGPRANGDCAGSCGQINMSFKEYNKRGYMTLDELRLAPGWTREKLRQFFDVWDRWHLNDMRAGCEHQRKEDSSREIEVVSYKLTSEALRLRKEATEAAMDAGLNGLELKLTPTTRALAELTDWFKPRYEPPDADSLLSGCYEVEKREQKARGWVYPSQHPEGLLTKACETCGYRYGSAWRKEDVPEDVLEFLRSLPNTDKQPAWV